MEGENEPFLLEGAVPEKTSLAIFGPFSSPETKISHFNQKNPILGLEKKELKKNMICIKHSVSRICL